MLQVNVLQYPKIHISIFPLLGKQNLICPPCGNLYCRLTLELLPSSLLPHILFFQFCWEIINYARQQPLYRLMCISHENSIPYFYLDFVYFYFQFFSFIFYFLLLFQYTYHYSIVIIYIVSKISIPFHDINKYTNY